MEGNQPIKVSFVRRCNEKDCKTMLLEEVFYAIRSGDHGLKEKITQIRNNYQYERDVAHSGTENAKKAVASFKAELPGTLFSGTFSERNNASLVEYSGLLCVDLDTLGAKLNAARESLKDVPYVRAIMLSPSGDGLKVLFNVVLDPARHADSFRAIQALLRKVGLEIDEKCKDLARICFFTYDPELWIRTEDNLPIDPLPPEPPRATQFPKTATGLPNLTTRELICRNRLTFYDPYPKTAAAYFCKCPGYTLHTQPNAETHTVIYLDGINITLDCQHTTCADVVKAMNDLLRSEVFRAEKRQESPISHPLGTVDWRLTSPNGAQEEQHQPLKDFLQFYSVSEVKSYEPPPGLALIGDHHVVRGSVTVIAGPPGVGKSRASVYLAVCGATQQPFFGLTVHSKFKTMILQCENGLYRLKNEFSSIDIEHNDFIRISDPPPYGFLFKRSDFRAFLKDKIAEFMPGVFVIDPWNRVEHGQDSRDYLDSFALVQSILPQGDLIPALIINAHHRKSGNEGVGVGRDLLKELSGGLALGSVPRTVFAMLHASDDTEENRIVWTCCKNNDGSLGKRSAWERKDGLFIPVSNFDWVDFDSATKADKRVTISDEMIEEVFEDGALTRVMARDKLMELSGATRGAVYKVLSPKGRFSDRLVFNGDMINLLRA